MMLKNSAVCTFNAQNGCINPQHAAHTYQGANMVLHTPMMPQNAVSFCNSSNVAPKMLLNMYKNHACNYNNPNRRKHLYLPNESAYPWCPQKFCFTCMCLIWHPKYCMHILLLQKMPIHMDYKNVAQINNTPNCCMQCPEKMPPKNVVCNVLICCNTYLTPSKYCMHKMLLRASVMMPKHIVCTYETPKQFMHPKMLH